MSASVHLITEGDEVRIISAFANLDGLTGYVDEIDNDDNRFALLNHDDHTLQWIDADLDISDIEVLGSKHWLLVGARQDREAA